MNCPKILLVEEEERLAVDIIKSLQQLGYKFIEITNSGEEAIEKMALIDPNLVLIDVCLSGSMGAKEIADIIEYRFHIPVLYLAEYAEIIQEKAGNYQLNEKFCYLHKPFVEKDLRVAVEMTLYKNQVEKDLRGEVQKLTSIIDGIGSGIVFTDINGCIDIMNPMAERLTGWKKSEALKRNLTEVVKLVDDKTDDVLVNLLGEVINRGEIVPLPNDCALVTKDGRKIPIGDSIAPVRDHLGVVCGAVLVLQDISQRKQLESRLMRNAFYDALTSLPNRVLFLDRLQQAFERAKRHHSYQFAVLFIDLDGFKEINDRYGHGVGDDLLIAIARRLEVCLRSGDTVARFGGDEFAAVIEEITCESDAEYIAHRIQDILKVPLQLNGHQLSVTASIGIAIHSDVHQEPANLLRDADIAMYQAKRLPGKASYAIFA